MGQLTWPCQVSPKAAPHQNSNMMAFALFSATEWRFSLEISTLDRCRYSDWTKRALRRIDEDSQTSPDLIADLVKYIVTNKPVSDRHVPLSLFRRKINLGEHNCSETIQLFCLFEGFRLSEWIFFLSKILVYKKDGN